MVQVGEGVEGVAVHPSGEVEPGRKENTMRKPTLMMY